MYLIDTDILIYSLKGDERVLEHFRQAAARPKALSVVSYGELLLGALKSERRDYNLARVRRVGELFPVVEVSRTVMETLASLKAGLETRGRTLDDFDLIIAATAMVLGYTLVTNNERHFRRIAGLRLENWARELTSGPAPEGASE
jgi:tRNA(fMet)-specific endonuclease VapC